MSNIKKGKTSGPFTAECRGSLLCGPETPFSQLKDVFIAALQPVAQKISLSVTALLSGGRGIGKRTIAKWAACDLGLHLYEVGFPKLKNDKPLTNSRLTALI
jgi:hypothetical protein